MKTSDISPMVRRIVEDIGVEVDDVLVFEDPAVQVTVKVMKEIRGEQYTSQVTIDHRKLDNKNRVKVLTNQFETMVRNLQEEAHEVHRPNDHYLVFETVDKDFHVEDKATGMKWDVKSCVHPEFESSFMPSDIPIDPTSDLSDGLVQQMKLWVIGWALENDRNEVLNEMAEHRYRRGEGDHTTERFKYHPAQ